MIKIITIYCDGSCKANGKENSAGGFGVAVYENDKLIDVYQHFSSPTTNNAEEMKAIIWALNKYGVPKDSFQYPVVYSDSAYCVNTFNSWIFNWKDNGWIKSDKNPPENLQLLKLYDTIYTELGKRIELRKVKGHSGIAGNELVDGLATGKIRIKRGDNNSFELQGYKQSF